MQGDVQYQKDKLGAVAMHNLIVEKREVGKIRESIRTPGTGALTNYLEETLGSDKSMRTFAHRVVNESLGGYF